MFHFTNNTGNQFRFVEIFDGLPFTVWHFVLIVIAFLVFKSSCAFLIRMGLIRKIDRYDNKKKWSVRIWSGNGPAYE